VDAGEQNAGPPSAMSVMFEEVARRRSEDRVWGLRVGTARLPSGDEGRGGGVIAKINCWPRMQNAEQLGLWSGRRGMAVASSPACPLEYLGLGAAVFWQKYTSQHCL
jgi:hypothetical protein